MSFTDIKNKKNKQNKKPNYMLLANVSQNSIWWMLHYVHYNMLRTCPRVMGMTGSSKFHSSNPSVAC